MTSLNISMIQCSSTSANLRSSPLFDQIMMTTSNIITSPSVDLCRAHIVDSSIMTFLVSYGETSKAQSGVPPEMYTLLTSKK